MNADEVFRVHRDLTDKALELMRAKNHDYAGRGGDQPFANFERCEALGICSTEQGIMVRLADKMSRMSTFIDGGVLKVQGEKVEDTIIDGINYFVLLYAYLKQKKQRAGGGEFVLVPGDEFTSYRTPQCIVCDGPCRRHSTLPGDPVAEAQRAKHHPSVH